MPNLDDAALQQLSTTIADYRVGEIPRRTPELIRAWLSQFPGHIQGNLLTALNYALDRTYISRTNFQDFLTGLAGSQKLSPAIPPGDYWRQANFLDIQQGGNSQKELLEMFDEVLQSTHGFGLAQTGSENGDFIYLDDCIATGSRVRTDVCSWIESTAPVSSHLHIISPILYKGSFWIDKKIQDAATANGKSITLTKWRINDYHLENRRYYRNSSDVLWPTIISELPLVEAYASGLAAKGHPVQLRAAGEVGAAGIFANDAQRQMLEGTFLTRGCEIRRDNPNLPESARPLGFQGLDSLGFGSMCVTYRNCPNNCPLAFWVEQDAYPTLFPRKTNRRSWEDDFLADF